MEVFVRWWFLCGCVDGCVVMWVVVDLMYGCLGGYVGMWVAVGWLCR